MITPQICQDYFANLLGHEGVAENAHQFAVMFAGRLERGEGFPLLPPLARIFEHRPPTGFVEFVYAEFLYLLNASEVERQSHPKRRGTLHPFIVQ